LEQKKSNFYQQGKIILYAAAKPNKWSSQHPVFCQMETEWMAWRLGVEELVLIDIDFTSLLHNFSIVFLALLQFLFFGYCALLVSNLLFYYCEYIKYNILCKYISSVDYILIKK